MQEEAESEGVSQPPMLDPITDLKLNQLDIVDIVRERQALLQVGLQHIRLSRALCGRIAHVCRGKGLQILCNACALAIHADVLYPLDELLTDHLPLRCPVSGLQCYGLLHGPVLGGTYNVVL